MPQTAKRRRKAKSTSLSKMVRRLHKSDENEKKYKGTEGLNSPHNETVTTFLVNKVRKSNTEHPPDIIRAACVAYYETVRRTFVGSLPENAEKTAKQGNDKRQRSRRKRLLETREAVIETEKEKALWTGVTVDFMSDEEDREEDGIQVWLVKPTAFRSAELTALCGVLQARLGKNTGHHTQLVLERRVLSAREPPPPPQQPTITTEPHCTSHPTTFRGRQTASAFPISVLTRPPRTTDSQLQEDSV
ncbi:uncharacterized protein C14orf93-like [Branchiostoma lanceolatum]|uniref:uncharacterized protein C14orf93-like n=1 Tax=Branchiostoma lanceolatum TaxID=7740 RepID=UPI003455F886